jgi:hypothetical protein
MTVLMHAMPALKNWWNGESTPTYDVAKSPSVELAPRIAALDLPVAFVSGAISVGHGEH